MANEINRMQVALKNASITLASQIAYIVASFICRTIFTKVLGSEYLGLNGLFSNILTMLSFVELGMGSALVYKMYKPLKEEDEAKLIVYMNFYRKVYYTIAFIMTILGLCVIPFLDYLVDAPNIDINIQFLYLLFLTDTVISYLYVYKKSILIADQKNYIVAVYTQTFNIIMNIGQIVILVLTHNYIIYLIFKILCDWLSNVLCSKYAEKIYPFIKKKTKEKISNSDKAELKENIKGLLLTKVASVAFDGTDNIFISWSVGISSVGILSNYSLILTTLNGLFNQIFYSITASIGNLGVDSSKEHVEEVLEKLYFLNAILYGYMGIGMTLLLKPFVVDIWVGEEYTLPFFTIFLLILELCLRGMHYPLYMTRSALGLFAQMKNIPPFCALLNIVLDFVLGEFYGIAGIITATIISRMIVRFTDVCVLYRGVFKMSVFRYYGMHFKFLLSVLVCIAVSYFTCGLFKIRNIILGFVVDIIIISIIYVIGIYMIYRKGIQFNYYKDYIKGKIKARKI